MIFGLRCYPRTRCQSLLSHFFWWLPSISLNLIMCLGSLASTKYVARRWTFVRFGNFLHFHGPVSPSAWFYWLVLCSLIVVSSWSYVRSVAIPWSLILKTNVNGNLPSSNVAWSDEMKSCFYVSILMKNDHPDVSSSVDYRATGVVSLRGAYLSFYSSSQLVLLIDGAYG